MYEELKQQIEDIMKKNKIKMKTLARKADINYLTLRHFLREDCGTNIMNFCSIVEALGYELILKPKDSKEEEIEVGNGKNYTVVRK